MVGLLACRSCSGRTARTDKDGVTGDSFPQDHFLLGAHGQVGSRRCRCERPLETGRQAVSQPKRCSRRDRIHLGGSGLLYTRIPAPRRAKPRNEEGWARSAGPNIQNMGEHGVYLRQQNVCALVQLSREPSKHFCVIKGTALILFPFRSDTRSSSPQSTTRSRLSTSSLDQRVSRSSTESGTTTATSPLSPRHRGCLRARLLFR